MFHKYANMSCSSFLSLRVLTLASNIQIPQLGCLLDVSLQTQRCTNDLSSSSSTRIQFILCLFCFIQVLPWSKTAQYSWKHLKLKTSADDVTSKQTWDTWNSTFNISAACLAQFHSVPVDWVMIWSNSELVTKENSYNYLKQPLRCLLFLLAVHSNI